MIIKGYRLRSKWSLRRFKDHVFRGKENEKIEIVRGSESDLDVFQRVARKERRTHGIRHFIIASDTEMTQDQSMQVIDLLGAEFRFDTSICVVVLHRKRRKTGSGHTHLHVMVPEADPVTGGTLDSSFSFLRHEKVSRIAEHAFGHVHQRGRHLLSVAQTLKNENAEVYKSLLRSFPDLKPSNRASFSHKALAAARSAGIDLPRVTDFVQTVRKRGGSSAQVERSLNEFGLSVRAGDKPGILVVFKDATAIQALHRMLGEKLPKIREEFFHVFKRLDSRDARKKGNQPEIQESCGGDKSRHPKNTENSRSRAGRRSTRRDRSAERNSGLASENPYGADRDSREHSGPSQPLSCKEITHRVRVAVLRATNNEAQLQKAKFIRDASASISQLACVELWFSNTATEIEAELDAIEAERLEEKANIQERFEACETFAAVENAHRLECSQREAELDAYDRQEAYRRRWIWRLFRKRQPPQVRDRVLASVEASKRHSREAAADTIDAIERRDHAQSNYLKTETKRLKRSKALHDRRQQLANLRSALSSNPSLRFRPIRFFEDKIEGAGRHAEFDGLSQNESPSASSLGM